MASPLVGRPPTCLACVRRIASTAASSSSSSSGATRSTSIGLTQVRGKKTSGRLKSQGVVIRLLQDVPQFGRQGSIFRTDAGRMRNEFFPRHRAEYMTRERLAELGLTRDDIGERDYSFRPEVEEAEQLIDDAVEAVAFGAGAGGAHVAPPVDDIWARARAQAEAAAAQALELEQLVPKRALELMDSLIPEPIIFERRMIHITAGSKKAAAEATSPESAHPESNEEVKEAAEDKAAAREPAPEPVEPAPALTPLQAHRARLQAEAEKAVKEKQAAAEKAAAEAARLEEEKRAAEEAEQRERQRRQEEKEAEELLKIHGSVTLQNIATALKDRMLLDQEASRIHVQPDMITFLGLAAGADRIEKIGTYEVEIRAQVGKTKVPPIQRTIKVIPL